MAKPTMYKDDILAIAVDLETVLEKSAKTAANANERKEAQQLLANLHTRLKELHQSGQLGKGAEALNQMLQKGIQLNKQAGPETPKPSQGNKLGR